MGYRRADRAHLTTVLGKADELGPWLAFGNVDFRRVPPFSDKNSLLCLK